MPPSTYILPPAERQNVTSNSLCYFLCLVKSSTLLSDREDLIGSHVSYKIHPVLEGALERRHAAFPQKQIQRNLASWGHIHIPQ
jgi:hypothetical protein